MRYLWSHEVKRHWEATFNLVHYDQLSWTFFVLGEDYKQIVEKREAGRKKFHEKMAAIAKVSFVPKWSSCKIFILISFFQK